ncbi:cyclin-like protein [Aulographum hederae CBS 113979]|uniref:Transcription initiation factor IIB n=1 Tax=Aulographum hederae CBS 113979 TaxID=1176131 RepID=A0A6G1GSH4_9PEZI|nr:cyclin-like protein [Aulographum hederae CBS 113979]
MNPNRVLSPGEVLLEEEVINKDDDSWTQDLSIKLLCPDCKIDPPNLREEFSSGDTVCDDCGLVLADRVVDTRSEWRTFANDDQGNDDPSRVGDAANPLLNGSQLQTSISFGDGGARNRELHRAQNKSTQDKSSAALLNAYREIDSYCGGPHGLSALVAETAKHLFKIVEDHRYLRGKSQQAIIASCIFLACRQVGVPRSFKEIQQMTKVEKKDIGRIFKQIAVFLQKHSKDMGNGPNGINPQLPPSSQPSAASLCDRFGQNLGLHQMDRRSCQELATKMTNVLAGRSPLTIAGAAIYIVAWMTGQKRPPKEIGEACGVSDGTIRNAFKSVYHEREKFLTEEWVTKNGGSMDRLPTL